MAAKPAKTLSALRQLACLGLPGKTILPEAIELLRALVGFDTHGVFHVDGQCRITDAYIPPDVPAFVLLDYVENFHNRPDGEGTVGPTMTQALNGGLRTVHASRFIERQAFVKTDFWNRIMRPAGMGWRMRVPLREGTRPLANLDLGRCISVRDFSASDTRLLEQVHPWLCHALAHDGAATPDGAEPFLPTGDSGTAVLDAGGRVVAASAGAVALLHQAAGVPLVQHNPRVALQEDAQTLLRRLAQAVGASLAGKPTLPPAGVVRNAHGTFHLRAYALDASAPGTPMQVSLHIERRAPLSLRLFRSPRFLALSARERDVCLGVLAGRSHTEIARRLGIKPSSVIHHTRSLYLRLSIGGRKELLPALLGESLS